MRKVTRWSGRTSGEGGGGGPPPPCRAGGAWAPAREAERTNARIRPATRNDPLLVIAFSCLLGDFCAAVGAELRARRQGLAATGAEFPPRRDVRRLRRLLPAGRRAARHSARRGRGDVDLAGVEEHGGRRGRVDPERLLEALSRERRCQRIA